MRECFATVLVMIVIGVIYFPQSTGHIAHSVFNELRIGWESVK